MTDKKDKKTDPTVSFVGSLDFMEFVIDPKNKDSDVESIGQCIAEYMKTLKDEDWSMFRFGVLNGLRAVRKTAEMKGKNK